MAVVATVVDVGALLETVAASIVAGVGVTIAFAVAIYGASRFVEARRDGRTAAAAGSFLVASFALAVCTTSVGAGIYVMVAD